METVLVSSKPSDIYFTTSRGKPIQGDSQKVRDFATKGTVTSLEVRRKDDQPYQDWLLLQDVEKSFTKAKQRETFQSSVARARNTLRERSAIGNALFSGYHRLDEIVDEQTSENVKRATGFTNGLLKTKPTGDLNDDEKGMLAVHVMRNLLAQGGEEVLLYDSREGINLKDSSVSVVDVFQTEKPMILRLEGLGGILGFKEGDDSDALAEMQAAVECGVQHPMLEDIKSRLSRSLGVSRNRIRVTEVFKGSVCVQYTVDDMNARERESILQQDASGKLAAEFDQFLELRIHPTFFRRAFDVAMFDERGNKSFLNQGSTFQIGPPGQTKQYSQPRGWTRYGLRALSGRDAEDRWLHPFQNPQCWWRAFHGTANAGRYMTGVDASDPCQMQNASVNAMAAIARDGFQMARFAAYGPGVYCSPNPSWIERSGYVPRVPVSVASQDEPKHFLVMFQVAVRPGQDTLQPASNNQIWAVRDRKWIRPYGILIKEVAVSGEGMATEDKCVCF